MTVLDATDLDRMAAELQSWSNMADVAQCYRRMLPVRVSRLAACLTAGDLDAAMDAVLSLRASSGTVGTCEMQALAHIVELELRRGDLAGARAHTHPLSEAAQRADHALAAFLGLSTAC